MSLSITRRDSRADRLWDAPVLLGEDAPSLPDADVYYLQKTEPSPFSNCSSVCEEAARFGDVTPYAYVLASLTTNEGWEEVYKTEDGITVSRKDNPDPAHPSLVAYRAVLQPVGDITIDQMYRAIWFKENSVGRIPHLKTVEVLENLPRSKTCYQVFEVSPLSNRHNLLSMTLEEKTATRLRISWDEIPLSDAVLTPTNLDASAVECPINQGYWELDLTTGTLTQVILTSPGGSVPSWAVNMATKSAIPDNLRTFLEYARTL